MAFATITDELVEQIAGRGLPLVPINSRSPIVAGSVTMDDEAGSRLAVDHLVDLGHWRIGFVAGRSDTDVGRRREAGYRTAMAAHDLPIDEAWVTGGEFTERGAHDAGLRLLDQPADARPTALYAVNLVSALGIRVAARELGQRIPEELSLVTMDDHPFLAHTDPALTAIHMAHRYGAGLVFIALLLFCWRLWGAGADARRWAQRLLLLAAWQFASGLSNVVLDWPIVAALAHTGGAALLLTLLSILLARLHQART